MLLMMAMLRRDIVLVLAPTQKAAIAAAFFIVPGESDDLRRQLLGISGAVLMILQRAWLVATLIRVIVSPCLSYLLHGLLGTSFQSVHAVLPLTDHVPCSMPLPADL